MTRMNTDPRFLTVNSFAASEAEFEEAGYSPPVPNPTIPRRDGHHPEHAIDCNPCDAVARMPPTTIVAVVVTIATLVAGSRTSVQ